VNYVEVVVDLPHWAACINTPPKKNQKLAGLGVHVKHPTGRQRDLLVNCQ
jgi:hypothetical protein